MFSTLLKRRQSKHRDRSTNRRLSIESIEPRVLLASTTQGQIALAAAIDPAEFTGAWVAQGPAPALDGQVDNVSPNDDVVGAVQTIAAHPTNANILYVGGVNGGVWKTTNGTAARPTWTPQTDDLPSLSIGALEFDPTDATNRTLVAGVGRFSSLIRLGGSLTGLLRTTNGGTTWTQLGVADLAGRNVSGVGPRGSTILVAASNFNGGVYRSVDNGATFQLLSGVAPGLSAGPVFDLVGDPADTSRFYASVSGVGIFRTDNMGDTWTNISAADATLTAAITAFGENNLEMAVSPIDGRLYLVNIDFFGTPDYIGFSANPTAAAPAFTSMDLPATDEIGGEGIVTTSPRMNPGGQGGIHLSVVADPNVATIFYVGGDRQPGNLPNTLGANNFSGRLFRGDTTQPAANPGNPVVGSAQWDHLTHTQDNVFAGGGTASNSAPHADSREMVFDANGNIIEADDGGVYRRTSPRTNTGDWFSINGNLQVTESHAVAYDPVSNVIISGNQDTGTTEQISAGSLTWRSASTGDGGDVAVDSITRAGNNESIRYSSFFNLLSFRRRVVDSNNVVQSDTFPNLTVTSGNPFIPQFYTPIALNGVDPTRILFGFRNGLYESLDQGDTIAQVNPGIVASDVTSHPIAYGGRSGGVDNPDVAYVGDVFGDIYVRTTAGGAFNLSDPDPASSDQIRDVRMDPDDWNNAFAVDQNQVFATSNGGQTWLDVTGDLFAVGASVVQSLEFVTGADDFIVVGTNAGVFASLTSSLSTWMQFGTSLPNAPVYDMDYNEAEDILVVGTLGRGIWTMDNAGIPAADAPEIVVRGNGITIRDDDTTPQVADGTDFGDAVVNLDTVTHTFTIENAGTQTLNVTGIELQGLGTSQFSLMGANVPKIIDPGDQATFSVQFMPTVPGISSAKVVIDNDDSNENPYDFTIRGRGLPPVPEIDVTGNGRSIPDGDTTPQLTDGTDFGVVETVVGAETHTFTIEDLGTLALTVDDISVSGTNKDDFTITAPPLPTAVAPRSGKLSFDVTFAPTAIGLRTATIRIDNNDANEDPYTFDVQGVGALAIDGAPLDADTNSFRVFGTSASAFVGFAYGTALGTSTYTGHGQNIRLAIKNPVFFAGAAASPDGVAYAELDVPARFQGQTLFYQAFEILPNPTVSVVVPLLLPLNALAGEGAGAEAITNSDLAAVRGAAVERLASASADGSEVRQKLASIDVVLQDLTEGRLGQLIGSTVFVDPTAAGHGWFVDSTPGDDGEFLPTSFDTELFAPGDSEAANHIDLLTVLMHELGHGLGWPHAAPGDVHALMADGLLSGIRRLPAGAAAPVEAAEFNQFVVNSTADASDANLGDGQCDVGGGNCTLRAAIEEANATANLVRPDVIVFDISGAGPHSIQPASPLPEIRQSVIIDATTEPDYAGTPVVELDGSLAGRGANGLAIDASGGGSTIRGLAINRFVGSGIFIDHSDVNTVEASFIGTDLAGANDLGNGKSGVRIINGDGNVVGGADDAGNVISGNGQSGVHIVSGAGNRIEGNRIGTDAAGNRALPNVRGIVLQHSSDNQIGGAANVISGNLREGVRVFGAATGNVLQRNLIGTNAAGDAALANRIGVVLGGGAGQNFVGGPDVGDGNIISGNVASGVQIHSSDNVVRGNLIGTNSAGDAPVANRYGVTVVKGTGNIIGGMSDAERNVISGNTDFGIRLTGKRSSDHRVEGNYIGTDLTGTSAIANRRGIVVETAGNTIGGEADGAGNVISGNRQVGVIVRGSRATGNVIAGNLIGTDAAQAVAVPNNIGVVVLAAADNTIGGAADGAGNVIAGNDKQGVKIVGFVSTGNLLQGNSIGVSADSSTPLPNQDGVRIASRAAGNTIGGSTAGAANEIAHNTGRGVWIAHGTGNAVSANSIHDNGKLGIDLGRSGVTANDPGDADRGANNLQNFPEISSAVLDSGILTFDFEVPSDAANAEYPIRIEFFVADADGEEGQTFLGSTEIAAPGVQQATIPAGAYVLGDLIVATATDADGNTSEFSAPAEVEQLPEVLVAAPGKSLSAAGMPDLYDIGAEDELFYAGLGQRAAKTALETSLADEAFAQF